MFTLNINPVLLDLGFLEIRYYGLVYALGFIFGVYWLLKYRLELGFSKDEIYDLMFYILLGGVIGARLWHVIVWEPGYYFSNLFEIVKFWKGGMAFHGGVIGGLVGGWWYYHKRKFNFWRVADILTIPLLIVSAFGRIANFINGELYGTVTNVKWCVNFGDGLCRHPVQIYSVLKRFAIAGIILLLMRGKHKDGFLFFLMITLLGLGRFFIDFLRQDIPYWSLSLGQWSSIGLVLIGGVVLIWKYKDEFKKFL